MADFEFKAPTTQRSMVRTVVAGVVVLILTAILIWAIVRHFQKQPEEATPANLPETTQTEGTTNEPTAPSDDTTDDNQTADNTDTSDEPTPADTTDENAGTDTQDQQLADTGPGDVVAIFVGAAALGGLAFELHMRRHLSGR